VKTSKFVLGEWLPWLFLGLGVLVVVVTLPILTELLGHVLGTSVWLFLWFGYPAFWWYERLNRSWRKTRFFTRVQLWGRWWASIRAAVDGRLWLVSPTKRFEAPHMRAISRSLSRGGGSALCESRHSP